MSRPSKTSQAVKQTVYRMKGQGRALCHLFKSNMQAFLKNVSYKKGQPKIDRLDHTHYFRNINSQLAPQTVTDTVGGHFHHIEWADTEDGPKVVKCGPAMVQKYVTRAGGVQRRVTVPVGWDDLTGDGDTRLTDNHTHDFRYIHSEELTEKGQRGVARENGVQDILQDSQGFD